MQHIHIFDTTIILAYLLICLVIGLHKISAVKTMKQYALGTGQFTNTVIIATIFATFTGAGSTMGVIGKVYTFGITFTVALLVESLSWLTTAFVFGNNIERFKNEGCLSLGDIMESLYGSIARWVTIIAAILQSVGTMAAQVSAMGFIFNYFLGIPFFIGVFLGLSVLTFYSAFGGIKAVAFTDVFQFIVFYLAIPTACAIAYHHIGGFKNLINNLPTTYLTINFEHLSIWLFLSIIFDRLLPHSEPAFVQRFLMTKNKKQVYRSLIVISLLSFPFILILSFIALIIKALGVDISPNVAFFYLVSHYLPMGVIGLLIIGMLSIIMSTADSWLNTTAVLCAHDGAKKLFPNLSDRQELLIARISTFVIGIFSGFLALQGRNFMEFIWIADNFWAPLVLIPLIAGFLKFKTGKKPFIISILTATICTILGAYIAGSLATISLFFGVVGSAVSFFGTHYWQVYKDQASIKVEQPNRYATYTKVNDLRYAFSKYLTTFKNMLFDEAQRAKLESIDYLFCAFVIMNYIIFLFTDLVASSVLHLHIVAAILSLLICFRDYWPQKLKKHIFHYCWYFTILFCLPFISSYTLLISPNEKFLFINAVLSIFLLYMLVNWFSFVILLSTGSFLGFLFFWLTTIEPVDYWPHNIYITSYVYCTVTILAILIFARAKEKHFNDKLKTAQLLGSAIAHEIRGPLSIIKLQIESLEGENSNIKESIQVAVKRSQAFINTILMNLKSSVPQEANEVLKISECIVSALEEYAFEEDYQKSVCVDIKDDFEFMGNKTFITHIITNMLNNSIYHTSQVTKPVIRISTSNKDNKKILTIYDNGTGIDNEIMCNLFKPFYSKRKSGIGIGLAFCKMVMESIGGKIECYSKKGNFTEFNLIFP